MPRTITVRGTGTASVPPDLIRIRMELTSLAKEYQTAVQQASKQIESLRESLRTAGYAKEALKTTDFNVNTEYDSIQESGKWERVFRGYRVNHALRLELPMDTERLSRTLTVLSRCKAFPEIQLEFTVKEPSQVSAQLLRSAAENARKKAEILTAASGVQLGTLLEIRYDWSEINVYSKTNLRCADVQAAVMEKETFTDLTPEDICAHDSASFVWEIK